MTVKQLIDELEKVCNEMGGGKDIRVATTRWIDPWINQRFFVLNEIKQVSIMSDDDGSTVITIDPE